MEAERTETRGIGHELSGRVLIAILILSFLQNGEQPMDSQPCYLCYTAMPGTDQNGGSDSGDGIAETVSGGLSAESPSECRDSDHETTADDPECAEDV